MIHSTIQNNKINGKDVTKEEKIEPFLLTRDDLPLLEKNIKKLPLLNGKMLARPVKAASVDTTKPINNTKTVDDTNINTKNLEIEKLSNIVSLIREIRLNLTNSNGQGFLFNAEVSVQSYLNIICRNS